MIRRPPRSTQSRSSAASDVYKRQRLYKTPAEREAEAARDPIGILRRLLLKDGLATDVDLQQVLADADREINEAADLALRAAKPAKDTARLWVFSPDVDPTSAVFDTPAQPSGKPDTMVAAINRTLRDEMARNPASVIFGEDVADATRDDALSAVPGKGGVLSRIH